ncbi:hypothetical protein SNEBB_002561, partial [Seison nebaliae]
MPLPSSRQSSQHPARYSRCINQFSPSSSRYSESINQFRQLSTPYSHSNNLTTTNNNYSPSINTSSYSLSNSDFILREISEKQTEKDEKMKSVCNCAVSSIRLIA